MIKCTVAYIRNENYINSSLEVFYIINGKVRFSELLNSGDIWENYVL